MEDNTLFNIAQEPHVGYVPHPSEDINKLAPTYERHPEERSASSHLGVVQIPGMASGPTRNW
jgi:hypothetical protein